MEVERKDRNTDKQVNVQKKRNKNIKTDKTKEEKDIFVYVNESAKKKKNSIQIRRAVVFYKWWIKIDSALLQKTGSINVGEKNKLLYRNGLSYFISDPLALKSNLHLRLTDKISPDTD
jgi:hypothetical protein